MHMLCVKLLLFNYSMITYKTQSHQLLVYRALQSKLHMHNDNCRFLYFTQMATKTYKNVISVAPIMICGKRLNGLTSPKWWHRYLMYRWIKIIRFNHNFASTIACYILPFFCTYGSTQFSLEKNGRHFADGSFIYIFIYEKFVFWLSFHDWIFFLRVQLTITKHCVR